MRAATAHPIAASKSLKIQQQRLARLVQICLSLPESVRRDGADHVDFRVRNKVFAYYLNDHHSDGITSLCCKSALGEHLDRARREPGRFYLPAHIGPRGWFGLRLDGDRVDWAEVANIVELSYCRVAPQRLARAVEGGHPPPARPRPRSRR